MGRRFTRRALVIVAIGGLLVAAASTAQAGWLFVIAAGVFALVGASLVTRHRLDRCEPARSMPSTTRVGDEVRVVVTLANRGRSPLPLMRVEDSFPAFEPVSLYSEQLGPQGSARMDWYVTVETIRRAIRRGTFSSGQVTLTSGAPFGLIKTVRRIDVASPMTVLPSWVELRSFPILEPASSPTDRLHERSRTGAGEEYLGVREYRPGDPRRAVHWRSTARAGRLVVREYEEPASIPVTIAMAGIDVGTAPDSSFEALVSSAASITLYALATGHRVNLVRPGPDGVEELRDPGRLDVLQWLAAATPIDAALDELVAPVVGRTRARGTVVLIATTRSRAGAGLPMAAHLAMTAGWRPIGVVVRSSSWSIPGSEPPIYKPSLPPNALRGRLIGRVVGRGEDLRACLETSRTGSAKPIQPSIPKSP